MTNIEQIDTELNKLINFYSNAELLLSQKEYNKSLEQCTEASKIFDKIHIYNKTTSEENRVKELYIFQVSILERKIRIQECIAKASQTLSFCDDLLSIFSSEKTIEDKFWKMSDLIDSTKNTYTFSELDYLLSKDNFNEAEIYRNTLIERTQKVISKFDNLFDSLNFLENKNVNKSTALLLVDILKKIAEKEIINIRYAAIINAEKAYDKFLKKGEKTNDSYFDKENLERIKRFRQRILNTINKNEDMKNTIEEPFIFFESSEHLACFFNCRRYSRFSHKETNNLKYFFEDDIHALNISIHYSYNDLNYYAYILKNKDLDYKKIYNNQVEVNEYIKRVNNKYERINK
jgi:hypothetical protein